MNRLRNGGHVTLTSPIDSQDRCYELANVSPTTTDMRPIRHNCMSTNVSTRALVDMLNAGTARLS